MKLYLIRHTTVDVKPGICYGQSDVGLNLSFQKELKRVKGELNDIRFEKMYSSPLSRCRMLSEQLFEQGQVLYDTRLKELDFGQWELQSWSDIYDSPYGKKWMDNYQTLPTLGGESYTEMVHRISDFLFELGESPSQNVGIVSHAGVIRIIKSIVEESSLEELFGSFKPAYGSVTIVDYNKNKSI